MGLTNRIPAIGGIQSAGCAPMVYAWQQGLDTAQPITTPRTHISTLATGDPGRTYTWLRQHMLKGGGGTFESVSDEEAFRAVHILAKLEGLSVEPAAAVAVAGLIRLVRSGQIKPTDVVVVNCSGHTLPVEKEILGEGRVYNLSLATTGVEPQDADASPKLRESPEEGLLAALSEVTTGRFSRILIVDDTPDARRLILRILQTQGDYTFYEAVDGRSAIEIARCEVPDLIVLDLMMPEVDGFAVLDALKQDARTAEIPVIVVTAKELITAEKVRLKGHIHSLMQKGEFMGEDLTEEVKALLG